MSSSGSPDTWNLGCCGILGFVTSSVDGVLTIGEMRLSACENFAYSSIVVLNDALGLNNGNAILPSHQRKL